MKEKKLPYKKMNMKPQNLIKSPKPNIEERKEGKSQKNHTNYLC